MRQSGLEALDRFGLHARVLEDPLFGRWFLAVCEGQQPAKQVDDKLLAKAEKVGLVRQSPHGWTLAPEGRQLLVDLGIHSKRAYSEVATLPDGGPAAVLFNDAEVALTEVHDLLGKSHPHAYEGVLQMIQVLIGARRKLVLYLGAGCTKQVDVQVPKGYASYRGRVWKELLEALLERVPQTSREPFLQDLVRRAGLSGAASFHGIDEILPHFDKLQLAWFLGRLFSTPQERNRVISSLVDPPDHKDVVRQSRLYRELMTLRFADVVTTNYDSNAAYFLQKARPNANVREILDSKGLAEGVADEPDHRIFYLHGKAGASDLILDRFDYAGLLAERDGIFDYVTFLLRDCHVIYIGFGLDDPTFNILETRLQTLHGLYRPRSWAFIPDAMEKERNLWDEHKLTIIDYGDHSKLPDLFRCINRVLGFVRDFEPDRPSIAHANDDRTDKYMQAALKAYTQGEFERSLEDSRAGLASTLFWEKTRQPGTLEHLLPLDRVARRCEIRIRAALNHYKLRSAPDERLRREHKNRLDVNVENAECLLSELETRAPNPGNDLIALKARALRASLMVLKARIVYHEGRWDQASQLYDDVIGKGAATPEENQFTLVDADPESANWILRLEEAKYYAKCQNSRITYQMGSLDKRRDYASDLQKLAHKIEERLVAIERLEKSSPGSADWAYLLKSFTTIRLIALWTAGRHAVGIFDDVIPKKRERTRENKESLLQAISLLASDKLPKSTAATWELSPRWQVMRKRYWSRALGLKWLLERHPDNGTGSYPAKDLGQAYKFAQEAIDHTNRAGFERQRVLSLLEAARLNVVVIFSERLGRNGNFPERSVTPLSFAAGLSYLDRAFDLLRNVRGNDMESDWVGVVAYRLASWFALVSHPLLSRTDAVLESADLRRFLDLDLDQISDSVVAKHNAFTSDTLKLTKRVSAYTNSFSAIRAELGE